jgi:hypothetical protein
MPTPRGETPRPVFDRPPGTLPYESIITQSMSRHRCFTVRLSAVVVSLVLTLTFAVIVIAAGHGVGPIGFVLIAGSLDAWGFRLVFGWLALVSSWASPFIGQRGIYLGIRVCSIALFVTSWLGFFTASESDVFTLITSVPFALALFADSLLLVRAFMLKSSPAR